MQETYREEYKQYLTECFSDAWEKSPMDFIYSILRVTGLQHGHWDPYIELRRAFNDYNKLLQFANEQEGISSLRVALLMYVQAIEMTAIHELLANLLRCRNSQPFIIKPFLDMHRSKKKEPLAYVPPSANFKIRRLKELAEQCGDKEFDSIIDSFYDDQIRNSFVHSDYCITNDEYRWTEGGPPSSKSLDYISDIIVRSFAFFEALLSLWKSCLLQFKSHSKYIKLPQYEVLELLTNDEGLYGFVIHFSNGNRAYFERHDERVESTNLFIESDGSINFFVGDMSKLEKTWKVNGDSWGS